MTKPGDKPSDVIERHRSTRAATLAMLDLHRRGPVIERAPLPSGMGSKVIPLHQCAEQIEMDIGEEA